MGRIRKNAHRLRRHSSAKLDPSFKDVSIDTVVVSYDCFLQWLLCSRTFWHSDQELLSAVYSAFAAALDPKEDSMVDPVPSQVVNAANWAMAHLLNGPGGLCGSGSDKRARKEGGGALDSTILFGFQGFLYAYTTFPSRKKIEVTIRNGAGRWSWELKSLHRAAPPGGIGGDGGERGQRAAGESAADRPRRAASLRTDSTDDDGGDKDALTAFMEFIWDSFEGGSDDGDFPHPANDWEGLAEMRQAIEDEDAETRRLREEYLKTPSGEFFYTQAPCVGLPPPIYPPLSIFYPSFLTKPLRPLCAICRCPHSLFALPRTQI